MNGKISTNIQDTIKETLRLQCITIFIEAYKISISGNLKKYDNDWDEDQFTAYLFQYMNDHPLKLEKQWIIAPQMVLYTQEISSGKVHANQAKKPDITFFKYASSSPTLFSFHIEAKNISEDDWRKKCGSKVKASQQRARYIDTGIQHFKEAIYPDGCLAGYVVQGDAENSVDKLNKLLKRRGCKAEILRKERFVNDFDPCYLSNHPTRNNGSIQLKHIFLKF